MPHFNIIKKNKIENKSFRVAKLYDQFDLNDDSFEECFEGDIDLEKEWQIGVIVGKSGTGKSTISRELFGQYIFTPKYKAACVIDDFPKTTGGDTEIFNILSSVGFSSPPSWLKPYGVLSNGEKMRVDLARAICENREIIVFDEYTSVVDREVAQLGSLALSKTIRKQKKKFIAVTCHFDVIDWLNPDWIFNTDTMQYQYTRGLVQRPKIKLEVYETRGFWEIFRRYHYLTHSLSKTAKQYVAFVKDKPVSFISFINMQHQVGSLRRVHRMVTLPDYQGLGIGKKLLNMTAKKESEKNDRIYITTSLKGFGRSLMADENWCFIREGRNNNQQLEALVKTQSSKRNTYSFRWVGKRTG